MNVNEELKTIEIENIIWVIYLFIIGANFISNYYVEKFIYTRSTNLKKIYRTINIIVLTIALIVYIYFVYLSYKSTKKDTTSIDEYLILIASILILIGGILYLYVEIDKGVSPDVSVI